MPVVVLGLDPVRGQHRTPGFGQSTSLQVLETVPEQVAFGFELAQTLAELVTGLHINAFFGDGMLAQLVTSNTLALQTFLFACATLFDQVFATQRLLLELLDLAGHLRKHGTRAALFPALFRLIELG